MTITYIFLALIVWMSLFIRQCYKESFWAIFSSKLVCGAQIFLYAPLLNFIFPKNINKITSLLITVPKDKKILSIALLTANLTALWEGIMDYKAAICLFFLFLVSIGYFRGNFSRLVRIILFIIIIAFALGTGFHIIPGFNNLLVINKLQISPESYPFSIYLNFDKVMAALIIFSSSNIPNILPNFKSIKITLFSLVICMIFISLIAIMSGYVKFEPKIPSILWIWALNNLVFVCFSEEVLFRGFFQNELIAVVKSPIISICITAFLFGLMHFHGGVLYILLSIICGVFYGYTYYRTGSLICSMLVHFGVNLSHFLLFTYPALLPN